MLEGSFQEIKARVKNVPARPGCYLWLGETPLKKNNRSQMAQPGSHQVLYVGKAIHLRNRISQYLNVQNSTDRNHTKTSFLLNHVRAVDWVVTHNEAEALLLENNLIKEHDPPYNVRLKDNKRYPFICLTMGEAFPRLLLTRSKRREADEYFGPYPNIKAARNTIHFIHQVFPIRKRPLKLPLKKPAKPCLNFHIGKCWAPCTGKVLREEYADMVEQVKDLLEGNTEKVKKELRQKMEAYAADMKYENAARIRNIIQDLETITTKQEVHLSEEHEHFDILAVHHIRREALFKELGIDTSNLLFNRRKKNFLGEAVLLKIRYGKLISKQNFANTELDADIITEPAKTFLTSFIRDYYLDSSNHPTRLYLSDEMDDREDWEALLSKKAGHSVALIPPRKNPKKLYQSLIDMALTNARSFLKERSLAEYFQSQKMGLRQIQKFLNLKKIPETIECYDISNFQGREAVGAGVFFKDGLPHKAGYRKYRIRLPNEPNDPGMMYEVLSRRFARIAKKEIPASDLILVDGGITQLNSALRACREHGLNIPVASLAKREEEVYLPGGKILKMDMNSPGMLILRAARDEAHRFSLSYHRTLRKKSVLGK